MLDEFVSSEVDENDDPLLKASRLTQEDWCIMEWKDEHQAYCLTAGLFLHDLQYLHNCHICLDAYHAWDNSKVTFTT